MHFTNKQFEKIYLNLLKESTEGVQFKYICKTCNTGFTEDNGVNQGDDCPVSNCEGGKVESFIADDIDPDNMPTAYEPEEQDDCDMEDFQDEDFKDKDQDDDCDMEDLLDDDGEFDGLFNENEDDQDFLVNECGDGEDCQDVDSCDALNDDFQDQDADDDAAEEDESDEDDTDEQEESDEKESEESEESKLVSFTIDNPELIELLNQVKDGELKLVAVPVDFEFEEDELNERPQLTSDTIGNLDIEDLSEDEESEDEESDEEDTDEESDNSEQDQAEDGEDITKESSAKCSAYCGVKSQKPSKYGPY